MTSCKSCLTLCDPVDYSPPVSSVHGVRQARILEWFPCLPPGDPPDPGIELASFKSPALAGRFFTTSNTWKGPSDPIGSSVSLSVTSDSL